MKLSHVAGWPAPARALALAGGVALAVALLNAAPALALFVSALPAAFHVLAYASLGVWCWALNVAGLVASGIDVEALFALTGAIAFGAARRARAGGGAAGGKDDGDAPLATVKTARVSPETPSKAGAFGGRLATASIPAPARGLFSLAGTFSAAVLVAVVAYAVVKGVYGRETAGVVQTVALGGTVVALLAPFDVLERKERVNFINAVARSFDPRLRRPVPFCDVIMADILCSFSKVFGDLHVSLTEMVGLGEGGDEEASGGSLLRPFDVLFTLAVALPPLVRFRQCVSEYLLAAHPHDRRRHLANSVKYLTTLPPIALATWAERLQDQARAASEAGAGPVVEALRGVLRAWIVSSAVSSAYSLFWDVKVDWDLGQVGEWPGGLARAAGTTRRPSVAGDSLPVSAASSTLSTPVDKRGSRVFSDAPRNGDVALTAPFPSPGRSPPPHPVRTPLFLRSRLHFRPVIIYYLAVAFDALARFAWAAKLLPMYRALDWDEGRGNRAGTVRGLVAVAGVDASLKLLEVARRWAWVYLRVEREWLTVGSGADGVEEGARGWV